MKKYIKTFWMPIVWAFIILYISTIKITISSTRALLFQLLYFDKILHAVIYAVMTYLLINGFKYLTKTNKSIIVYSFFISTLYGGIIELIQGYLTNYRSSEWLDLLSNIAGSFIISIYYYLYRSDLQNIKVENKIVNNM